MTRGERVRMARKLSVSHLKSSRQNWSEKEFSQSS
mgnify:CR=1 FL=1